MFKPRRSGNSDGIKFIKDSTFAFCENLTTIIIPQSVKEIGNLAFYRDSSNYLSNVLFKGSKSQWDSIHISGGYTDFFDSVIHYDVKFVEKKHRLVLKKVMIYILVLNAAMELK